MATEGQPSGGMGWLEQQFATQNIVVLCIFGFCCGIIAAILAAIVYFTGKNEVAKKNALIVMIIGAVMFFLYGGGICCGGGGGMINKSELAPKEPTTAVASLTGCQRAFVVNA